MSAMSPDRDAVLTAVINIAHDTPEHIVFVLDDYHLIEDPAIHEALTFLLDHLPPNLHFVLASRGEPPLPLARLVALSLQQGLTKVEQTVVNGHHRFIADYLSQEIVSQLPGDIQQFLLRTSILDRLCASLCQAVTNNGIELRVRCLQFLEWLFLSVCQVGILF